MKAGLRRMTKPQLGHECVRSWHVSTQKGLRVAREGGRERVRGEAHGESPASREQRRATHMSAQGHAPTRHRATQHSHEVAPGETVTCVMTEAWHCGHTQFEGRLPLKPLQRRNGGRGGGAALGPEVPERRRGREGVEKKKGP